MEIDSASPGSGSREFNVFGLSSLVLAHHAGDSGMYGTIPTSGVSSWKYSRACHRYILEYLARMQPLLVGQLDLLNTHNATAISYCA